MSERDLIAKASAFLTKQDIGFVKSGKIGKKDVLKVEVIFPVPETLDPNIAIIDPPDVRVWVNTNNNEVELIHQM